MSAQSDNPADNVAKDPTARAFALRKLPRIARAAFVDRAEVKNFEPGETLFSEGDPSDEIFLIVRGGIWLRKQLDGGDTSNIALRSDLEWLGEMSLDGISSRSASAVAESRVRTLAWSREEFVEMLDEYPAAARDLLTYVSQHVRESDAALVDALRKRTHDLLTVNQRLGDEVRRLKGHQPEAHGFERFLGHSAAAGRVRRDAERAARGDGPALLVGEAGTGRGLVARCIHEVASSPDAPFLVLDASHAPEGWTEAELLGSAEGATSSGVKPGPGLLERCEGGTLYVESVDDLPLTLQSVLLRFIRTGCFERIGESRVRSAQVRLLTSTTGDPRASVRDGRLRQDLLQELDRLRVNLPPLRSRRNDIPLLAAQLLAEHGRLRGVDPLTFAPSALRVLSRYDFPGNLGELEGEIELLYTTLDPGSRVTSQDLGPRFVQGDPSTAEHYSEAVRAFKAQLISNAVREAGGNRARAAERLGLHRSNLTRMIRDLELDSVL